MHKQEMKLYHLLVRDPRMSYRELAERTGASLQAIHKQVQSLYEQGIFIGSTASLSSSYLNATDVFIFGRMEDDVRIADVVKELRKDDRIGYVMLCSSNMVYVSGILRRVAEMDAFTESVKKICHMRQATLAIETMEKAGDISPVRVLKEEVKLSPLDLRIVSSLRYDARKSYQKVAEEVGITPKTVRLRLDRMIEEGSVNLVLAVNPTMAPAMSSVIHIKFMPGVDRNAMGAELMNAHPEQVLFYRSYANLPNMISLATNHDRMDEMRLMLEELNKDERVSAVEPNIVITAWGMETWRDKLLPKPGK